MKNLITFKQVAICFLFLMSTFTVSAQWGNNESNRIEEDRKVGNFDAVSVGYGIDVHLYLSLIHI